MPSIGGVTVFSVAGQVLPLQMAVESFERPGVHGHGGIQQGLRGDPYQLTIKDDHTSNANREAQWNTLRALSGQVVTVVDDEGNTYTNQMLLGFSEPVKKTAAFAVGGRNGGRFMLEVKARMQAY